MKKLLFCLAAMFPFLAGAQTNTFTVSGKTGITNVWAKVYLAYKLGANQMLDSTFLHNGEFSLTGEIPYPTNATLLLDHTGAGPRLVAGGKYDMLNLFLERGTITVTGTDSIATAKITGSRLNDDNALLMAKMAMITTRAKKLEDVLKSQPIELKEEPEIKAAAQATRKAIQQEYEKTLRTFVKDNPNSYISLLALSSLGGASADPAVIEPLYTALSPDLKATEPGKLLGNSINELKVTAIGAMAPDFTQNDANGTPIKLSSFRGKYVLLDFWASWCGPCRQENPNVVRAYNKYKAKKFTVLGVSLDQPGKKADWMAAIELDGLTWPQVSDLQYWNNAVAKLYFVSSIPQNFLIDPTGKIVGKNLRGEDLDNKLAEIFGKI